MIELRRLCDYYCTVPASYQLAGIITKGGDHPQTISQETEVWKGRHNGRLVALKVLRGPQDNHHLRETKSVGVA